MLRVLEDSASRILTSSITSDQVVGKNTDHGLKLMLHPITPDQYEDGFKARQIKKLESQTKLYGLKPAPV